jgi:hypothetical protein
VGTRMGADHRLGVRERGDEIATQEENQPHALDAAPGRAPVTTEQLSVPPAEGRGLCAPAVEEPLGVQDQLLPGVLRIAARGRCIPQECNTFDPLGRSPLRCRDRAGMLALQPLACGVLDT